MVNNSHNYVSNMLYNPQISLYYPHLVQAVMGYARKYVKLRVLTP